MADKKTTKKPTVAATEVKTIEQLRADLATKLQDQLEAKKSHAAGELVNPRVITAQRKEIARIRTAIRAAELTEQKESK